MDQNNDDGINNETVEDYILYNQHADMESPKKNTEENYLQRRTGKLLFSTMDIEDKNKHRNVEEYDQDISKSVKIVSSCCRYLREKIEEYTKLFTFIHHTTLLLDKNYILAMRSKSQLLYLCIVPVFLLLLVRFFQTVSEDFTSYTVLNQPINQINSIDHCFHPTDPCLTIGYGIIVSFPL